MAKWGTILGAFDIQYLLQTMVKGQVLVDLVGEFTEELKQVDSEEVGMPEEGLRINTILSQQTWQLFVDGASNQKGMGVGITIIFLEGITLEKCFRLSFLATNNEAEYETLQAGLFAIQQLRGKLVKVHCDSRFIVGQVRGESKAKDPRMQWYVSQVKHLLDNFESFTLEQLP